MSCIETQEVRASVPYLLPATSHAALTASEPLAILTNFTQKELGIGRVQNIIVQSWLISVHYKNKRSKYVNIKQVGVVPVQTLIIQVLPVACPLVVRTCINDLPPKIKNFEVGVSSDILVFVFR